MLSYLSVEHYKSLSDIRLGLGQLNVFVGPNGAGKSNLIDSVMFIRDCVRYDIETAISQRFGIDSIRQWSWRAPFQIRLAVGLRTNSGIGRFSVHLGSAKGHHRIIAESGYWEMTHERRSRIHPLAIHRVSYERDATTVTVAVRAGDSFNQVITELDDTADLFLASARSFPLTIKVDDRPLSTHLIQELWRALYDFEAYSIFPNTLRTPQSISNEQRLTSNGDNITTIFKNLSKSKAGQHARAEILDGMKAIMPGLENIIVQSAGGFLVPSFRVREENATHDFNVSQISDGTLRVFGMLTALNQLHAPSVMALEEPEQTIHPGALLVVADSIAAAARNKQIFVTTHSPHLLDFFGVDSLWAVRMENASTKIGRVSEDQRKAIAENLFRPSEVMAMEGFRIAPESPGAY